SAGALRASAADRLLPAVRTQEVSARRPIAGGFQFRIGFHEEASPECFRADVRKAVVQLQINQNHPFYRKLYMHSAGRAEDFDLLLLSAARALFDLPTDARQSVLRTWSDNLLAYLER